MQELEFLPQRYSDKRNKRRVRGWQSAVIAAFVIALTLAGWGQQRIRLALVDELAFAEQQYETAQQAATQQATLQQQLAEQEIDAAVINSLRQRWPRSQLLHIAMHDLPEAVRLDEVSVAAEEMAAPSTVTNPTAASASETTTTPTTDAQLDLAQLNQEREQRALMMTIRGVTRNHASLNDYLIRLGRDRLVRRAELSSLEATSADPLGETRFVIRVTAAPMSVTADDLQLRKDVESVNQGRLSSTSPGEAAPVESRLADPGATS